MTDTTVSKLDSVFAGFQAVVDIPDLAAGLAGRVLWDSNRCTPAME
jgi:hypothetical protein